LRTIRPAPRKKQHGEEGNKNAVAVLRIEVPFPPAGAKNQRPRPDQGKGDQRELTGGGWAESVTGHLQIRPPNS
jgi:hypothetical protein